MLMPRDRFLTIRIMNGELPAVDAIRARGARSSSAAIVEAAALCRSNRLNTALVPEIIGRLDEAGERYNRAARAVNRSLRRIGVMARPGKADWKFFTDILVSSSSDAREAADSLVGSLSPLISFVRKYDPVVLVRHTRCPEETHGMRVNVRMDRPLYDDLTSFSKSLGVNRSEAVRFLLNLGAAGACDNNRNYLVVTETQVDKLSVALSRWHTNRDQMIAAAETVRSTLLGSRYLPDDLYDGLAAAAAGLPRAFEDSSASVDDLISPILTVLGRRREEARAPE